MVKMEMRKEQVRVLKGIQERRSISEIAESIEYNRHTVNNIIRGMMDDPEIEGVIPKEYQCRLELLKYLGNNDKLNNSYMLTAAGIEVLEHFMYRERPDPFRVEGEDGG